MRRENEQDSMAMVHKIHFHPVTLTTFLIIAATFAVSPHVRAETAPMARPYESTAENTAPTPLDTLVLAGLRKQGAEPARICSDEVFVRRVYLDVIGALPTPIEVQRFLASNNPGKRAALIDALLDRDEFAEYWALKWCDLLRVKSEFPINLWPNAVQAYHRWIRDALRQNMPYDQFVREQLTSSGSNFRMPPVNFYRAIQGHEPPAIARAVGLTFMGVRLENWPEAQRKGMEAFFSRVAFKGTDEWKEEIVYNDPSPAQAFQAILPSGVTVTIKPGEDPRAVFAQWLIAPENPWFARNINNRIWAWLMGRGLINEPDDIRPDNPALYPEVLDYLDDELVKSGYDLRHIYRLILNSRTYQQSSIPQGDPSRAGALFACYPVRQLDAEVLIDALCDITGTNESYSSPIPEPFTFIPDIQRSISLADGSITSQFLEMYGRPSRDTGLETERGHAPTDAQRLHMLNSSHIQKKIEGSQRNLRMGTVNGGNPRKAIGALYLTILSRYPTPAEVAVAEKYYRSQGVTPRQAAIDLTWALINTKEFLFRH